MINLEKILDNLYEKDYRNSYKTEYPKQCILAAMKEACEKVVELAVDHCYFEVAVQGRILEEVSINRLKNYIK